MRAVRGFRVAAVLLVAALSLASAGHAETALANGRDGGAVVTIDGEPVAIPTVLAQGVADALAKHGNDPARLEAALRQLMDAAECGTALECERLAAAVVVLAVSKSSRDAEVVEAIVRAVAAAVPAAGTEALVAAVGLTTERRDDPSATARATVEPPRSASPTE